MISEKQNDPFVILRALLPESCINFVQLYTCFRINIFVFTINYKKLLKIYVYSHALLKR